MSVIQKMFDAWDAKDKCAVASIVHDDFVMTSHAQGAKMTKQDMLGWLEGPQLRRIILGSSMKTMRLLYVISSWNFQAVIKKQ